MKKYKKGDILYDVSDDKLVEVLQVYSETNSFKNVYACKFDGTGGEWSYGKNLIVSVVDSSFYYEYVNPNPSNLILIDRL